MEYSMVKFGELHVGDVYDLAAEIGKEFETTIDKHGLEVVTDLMPKVINALEHLEAFAISKEQQEDEVNDLQGIVSKLEHDKAERTEFRHKFEQEVEQIEENWKKESKDLSELVSRLQEENHRLSSLLAEKEESCDARCSKVDSVSDDVKLAQKLKELVDKQRDQLHTKDMELLHRSKEIDSMQQEVEHLSQSSSENMRRLKHLQVQMRTLVEEKSDLQAQVQDQQREIQCVNKRLSEALKENMDLQVSPAPDLRRKLIIDPDDPNRPRFTLEELRNILFEKNDLKARVSELEDELSLYKPSKQRPSSQSSSTSTSGNDEPDDDDEEDDRDLPVQGPINREPDDKLFPGRKSLGIRRFFRSLWKGIESTDENAITMVPFPAFRQSTGRY